MKPNVIEFVNTEKKSFVFKHDNVFTFRKDRKHHWLQKACFWVLAKIGANWREDQVKYERIVFDSGKFMTNLFQQMRDVQREFNRRPTKLLVGSDNFDEIMSMTTRGHQFEFNAEYNYGEMDEYGRTQAIVHGLNVKVIPWMRGILVLP